MKLSFFDYELPKEFIAQKPLKDRSGCKMLFYDKKKDDIKHLIFSDIVELFTPNDLLILNDTKVLPAKLFGIVNKTCIEILLTREENDIWEILAKPKKRLKEGTIINFEKGISCKIISLFPLKAKFNCNILNYIEKIGKAPLPPYIKRNSEESDKENYQTVYAKSLGSIAAPTAGLHWTKELLSKLEEKGVSIFYITLHIGKGTFVFPKTEDVEKHKMDSEYVEIPKNFKIGKKRVIACGTSVVRAIESLENIEVGKKKFWTDLFIYPGFKFKWTDGMITNFHFPKSPPFIMTSSFVGLEKLREIYEEAKRKNYRFGSYGDCMIVL